MAENVAIILARGGSKGIPRKNIVDLCGMPLLAWSILQANGAKCVTSTWVSSDDAEILGVARAYGASVIERPTDLANDEATSESGWLHAIEAIQAQGIDINLVVGLQATSPLRQATDIDRAIDDYCEQGCDSLLSVALLDDFLVWQPDEKTGFTSVNYDYHNRGRRQDRKAQYHENGSIYVFTPEMLRRLDNRLGGRIGVTVMPMWKSFQVDEPEDLELCETILRRYMSDQIQDGDAS
jgi:CMP-N,N'-diacetyllegionaminic acid synthase